MSSTTETRTAVAGTGRQKSRPRRAQPPTRIVIQYPSPAVDEGRYPAKRCVGDEVQVQADVFRDGHERLRAVVRYRGPGDRARWREAEMRAIDAELAGVRWGGSFKVERTGNYEYTISAWTDVFGTWRDELARKLAAGQHDLAGEISEGVLLLREALEHVGSKADKSLVQHALITLEDPSTPEPVKHDVVLGPELFEAVERCQERHDCVTLERPLKLEVDRTRARFGAWYELFPRSWGALKGVEKRIPELAELGFDVVYLAPIHPIGHTNRKGRDNALLAGPKDPGSPWAIGDESGGHDAVHADLGTLADVRTLAATAAEHGIDICLDFAIRPPPITRG